MRRKKKINKYPIGFRKLALEHMKTCRNVKELSAELGIDRTQLYRWRKAMEATDDGLGLPANFQKREPFDFDDRLRRADGTYRWFQSCHRTIRDAGGRVIRWHVLLTDIDDRKQAEEKLRRSEACLSEAQKLSHTGSFGWDVSSGEIYWSPETFRIFEYDLKTNDATIGLVLQRIHPEDRPAVEQLIERVSREGKKFDFKHRLLMPDQSIKYLRVVGSPIKDHAGLLKFVGAVTDITERKRAEDERRRSEERYRVVVDTAATR